MQGFIGPQELTLKLVEFAERNPLQSPQQILKEKLEADKQKLDRESATDGKLPPPSSSSSSSGTERVSEGEKADSFPPSSASSSYSSTSYLLNEVPSKVGKCNKEPVVTYDPPSEEPAGLLY